MKVAFNIITKGDKELDSLKRLIESIKPIITNNRDIFITANHGHERTKKWCNAHGMNFSYLKWNKNFAEQRNFNFSQVPAGYDYHLWADADDVIVNPEVLKDVFLVTAKRGFEAVFFTYWYGAEFEGEPSLETFIKPELTQTRERLLKRGSFIWKKRIHETPVPLDGENHTYTKVLYSEENPVAWLHLGADRNLSQEKTDERTQRNLELLEMELDEERPTPEGADPRTILYLMKVLVEQEEGVTLARVLSLGEEYLLKSGWDQERGLCLRMMGRAAGKLGDHIKERKFLLNSLDEWEKDPLSYFYLARAYFNLEDYSKMKHWMDMGLKMETEENSINNLLDLKILSAELMLKYYTVADKDVRKAWNAAKILNKVNPTPQNQQNEEFLFNQKELDLACESLHKVIKYMEDIGDEARIPSLISSTPTALQQLPFAVKYVKRHSKPRVWGDNEIAYFANFGRDHFERWGPQSINKGIGGSEQAVIHLSREWGKMGYKVTVYADTGGKVFKEGNVTWLPYFAFNTKDRFNILIQWRSNNLAHKVYAKKLIVDLHDLYNPQSYEDLSGIDKVMVKSNFHRDLMETRSTANFKVVSNGI